jgi:cytochrome c2/Ca2+/Na+ antiporter
MKLTRKPGITFWLAWHSIAVLALVLLPGLLLLGKPAWSLADTELRFLVGIGISYITCVLILGWLSRRGQAVLLRDLILVVLAVFGIYFFLLLLTGSYFSRPILLATFVFAALFILFSFSFASSLQTPVLVAVALVLLVSQFMADDIVERLSGGQLGPHKQQHLIHTEFYDVRATIYRDYIDRCPESEQRCGPPTTSGGGISTFGDGYLLATGEGDLFSLVPDSSNELVTRHVQTRIPLDTDTFRADNGDTDIWLYRVTDILVDEKKDGGFRLFAAHHHWNSEQHCSVLRISRIEGDRAAFLAGDDVGEWQTVYDSEPCLPVTKGRRGDRFKGADSGGRMVMLDDGKLLFSVGDYQVDGWNREEILAQKDGVAYGKMVLIDPETGKSEIYSRGHRNPQGLYAAPDASIWETEHGPRGGDELNLILRDANYGWPMVTYGTEYGEKLWPLSSSQGQHAGYQRPIFSWVPSIAVSNVIGVEADLFPLWKGDLLVASYKQSLWRLRVREGRVIYAEPVPVVRQSGRIRDLMEDQQGRIVLWLDGGSIAILEPLSEADAHGDDIRGQVLYVQCAACHNIKTGGGHPRDSKVPGIGPDLLGVAGNTIAAAPGYDYSDALKNLSGTWSSEKLDRFLENPQAFAPGTRMQFQGIADADERKKVIQYLTTLK